VPEGGVVARVVVGVADADVEYDPAEELVQGRGRLAEPVDDRVRQLVVRGVPGGMLGQPEQCERGHDHAPATAGWTVEALDEQQVPAHDPRADPATRSVDADPPGEVHGDRLGAHDRVGVRRDDSFTT
jgi:hypothetical protein